MRQSGESRSIFTKTFSMLIDIVSYIIVIIVFMHIMGKVVLYFWAFMHMFDNRYGNMQMVNPNDSDFFPNFDLFKKKVMEIENRDMETRLYLLSRKNRLNRIKNKKGEGRLF